MIVKAIKYGTDWCQPCHVMEANLRAIGILYETVDLDENEEIADQKSIQNIPFTEFLNEDGEVVYSYTGLMTLEDIREVLDSCGNRVDIKRI